MTWKLIFSFSVFQEFPEEELEWLSNKDAFPAIETFVDVLSLQPNISNPNHQNIVSKHEYSTSSTNSNNSTNSSTLLNGYQQFKVPVRARSKRGNRCRRGIVDISSQQFWWNQPNKEIARADAVITISTIGRKCQHCGAEKTPQWRAGPSGPKTLCNACGVRYKSGRLVPEYRPASSPSFCSELHSNSHRKVMEMRKQKQMGMALNTGDKGWGVWVHIAFVWSGLRILLSFFILIYSDLILFSFSYGWG